MTQTQQKCDDGSKVQQDDYINPNDFSAYYDDENTRWQGVKMDNDSYGNTSVTLAWDGNQLVTMWRREGVRNQDGSPVQYKVKAVADYDDFDVDVELEESDVAHYKSQWNTPEMNHEDVEEETVELVECQIRNPSSSIHYENISWSGGTIQLTLYDEPEGVSMRAYIN